jgi:hypothetical protein
MNSQSSVLKKLSALEQQVFAKNRFRELQNQVVLSSLVRRFTVEPFKEYATNPFTG